MDEKSLFQKLHCLNMLCLCQFRHPDVVQSARSIFLILGVSLILETLGYYIHSVFYYITFTTVYLGIVFSFFINIYWNGDNPGVLGTLQHMSKRCHLQPQTRQTLDTSNPRLIKPKTMNIGLPTTNK